MRARNYSLRSTFGEESDDPGWFAGNSEATRLLTKDPITLTENDVLGLRVP